MSKLSGAVCLKMEDFTKWSAGGGATHGHLIRRCYGCRSSKTRAFEIYDKVAGWSTEVIYQIDTDPRFRKLTT